jgi:LysR family transcriptional regulator, glycine cleavage system transcriptional activator
MKDLPLNALRAFATIYSEGGVRSAARALGITHSSVSRHLAELGEWLGAALIDETASRRGIVFTPQGEALGKTMLSSLRDIERAVASVRETRSARSVTISTTPSFAARWLLSRLPRLEEAHPHIEVSVRVDQKVEDPETAGADLAIRMGGGPWRDLRCEPLMDDWLYPVISPTLLADPARLKRPSDLVGLRLLHDRDPNASWERWRQAFGPKTLDVLGGPRFASSDLVLRAAAQGQGVALARHRLAMDDIASGALVRPLSRLSVPLERAYWLVLPARGRVRPATAAVVEWLKKEAARH